MSKTWNIKAHRLVISAMLALLLSLSFPISAFGEQADVEPPVFDKTSSSEPAGSETADEGSISASDTMLVTLETSNGFVGNSSTISVDGIGEVECDVEFCETIDDMGIQPVTGFAASRDSEPATLLMDVPAGVSAEEAISALENLPGVVNAQPNYLYESLGGVFPNDPLCRNAQSSQYYLFKSRITDAWAQASCDYGISVAVLDTGCRMDHEDLAGILDFSNAYDAHNDSALTSSSASYGDPNGHGTHVCGILGAQANNGIGIAGASYNAKVIPVKVFDDYGKSASTLTLTRALEYLMKRMDSGDINNLKVINMSLGVYRGGTQNSGLDLALEKAIDRLREEYGVLCVCAGGNGDDYTREPRTGVVYPSDYDKCLSVTALQYDGSNFYWSDYNQYKDISTYGGNIYSTYKGSKDDYTWLSGTSMAAPVVSGAAALLWAANPSLSVDSVVEALETTAAPVDDETNDRRTTSGSKGSLDAAAAMREITGLDAGLNNDLDYALSWDKSSCLSNGSIKGNTPVTFTISGKGGSGNYKYWVGSVGLTVDDDYYYYDSEFRNASYKTDNMFTYTFVSSGKYRIQLGVQDTSNNTFNTGYYYLTINDPSCPSLESVADTIVADCDAKGFATEYEKALFFHDRITQGVEYDHSWTYAGAAGVLLRKKGTCESFHRAYTMLLERAGIATSRQIGGGHVWTAVRLDGVWTMVDATWDAGTFAEAQEYKSHLYFGITDEMIAKTHTGASYSGYPCDSLERNYFIRSGEITKWSGTIKDQILKKADNGATSFRVDAAYHSDPTIYKIIYPLVAHWLNKEQWENRNISVSYCLDESNYANSYYDVNVIPFGNVESFVSRLYQNVLNRSYDVGGLNTFSSYLHSGGSAAEVAWGFFGSDEFSSRALSNEDRITIAYRTMLDREPDSSGLEAWKQALSSGMSIRAIVAGFSGSDEFRALCSRWGILSGHITVVEPRDVNPGVTGFVSRLYFYVLDRQYDTSGLNNHVSILLSGGSAAEAAWGFFGSQEFMHKALSDEERVTIAYRTMLDREPDPVGLSEWKKALRSGMGMRNLILGFAGSDEFSSICAQYGIRK